MERERRDSSQADGNGVASQALDIEYGFLSSLFLSSLVYLAKWDCEGFGMAWDENVSDESIVINVKIVRKYLFVMMAFLFGFFFFFFFDNNVQLAIILFGLI